MAERAIIKIIERFVNALSLPCNFLGETIGKNKELMMRRFSSICSLVIVAVIIPCNFTFAETKISAEEELYQRCKKAFSEGNFSEADQHIRSFLSLYPESDRVGEMLFMHAGLQKDVSASMNIYKVIIDKYPKSEWAGKSHFQLGQLYYMQGKYDKASDHFGQIVLTFLNSEVYWPARYWRCKSFLASKDYKRAIDALRALENSRFGEENKDMITMTLGECYIGLGEDETAANLYRSLIESMPKSQWVPSAYMMLAKSLQNLGKLEEARTLYQKVAQDYSRSVEALQARQCLDSLPPVGKLPVSPSQSKPQEGKVSSQLESQFLKAGEKENQQAVNTQGQRSDSLSMSLQIKWDEERPPALFYSIQVGAFSKKSSAESLANRLKKKRYSASVVPPSPGEDNMYKVRIGKFKTKDDALEMAQKLSKNERLEAIVVPIP